MPLDGTPFAPSPLFAEWRSEAPATRLTAEDGNVGWFVTGYGLAREVLVDLRFNQTNQRTPVGEYIRDALVDDPMVQALMSGNVLGLDPPQHTRIRRAVTSRFAVRSVRGRLPEISAHITRRLDEIVTAGGPADLFRDLGLPVSVFAHCRVLGIPDDRRDGFAAVFAIEDLDPGDMVAFAAEMLELKKDDLGEDTLSDLLRSELTHAEQLGITTLLMASGRDAIAFMIGTMMASLLTNPAQLDTLREDPARIPAAVEELLRFNAMFLSVHPRTVAEDVTIRGIQFRAGESVWVSTVAANRDGARFAEPDTLDVTRDAYGHLTFGHGVHTCLGQQLARAVIIDAISQLLRRFPTLRLVDAEQLTPMRFAGHLPTYSPGSVHVAWD